MATSEIMGTIVASTKFYRKYGNQIMLIAYQIKTTIDMVKTIKNMVKTIMTMALI